MTSVLAIIPARAGSKGVPGKNVYPVAGRPLIAWTIDAARRAAGIDRVVVSTDSEEIATVAREHGAEVPVLRPADLARDETPGTAPILHMVEWLDEHEQYRPHAVMVLQPTSPLRQAEDIEGAMELMRSRDAESVASVSAAVEHLEWRRLLAPDGRFEIAPDVTEVPARHRILPSYVLNGAIYLVSRDVLVRRRSLYAEIPYGYVMPRGRSLDIDSRWDLHVADLALRHPFQP